MRPNFLLAIGLIVLGSLSAATATTDMPIPVLPAKTAVMRNNAVSQDKVIIACPQTIQAGPVYVPAGWQSLGSLVRQRVGISIDKKQRLAVCWYGITGGDQNLFTAYLISQPLPAGYNCTIPYPKDYAAVCTKGIHIPK